MSPPFWTDVSAGLAVNAITGVFVYLVVRRFEQRRIEREAEDGRRRQAAMEEAERRRDQRRHEETIVSAALQTAPHVLAQIQQAQRSATVALAIAQRSAEDQPAFDVAAQLRLSASSVGSAYRSAHIVVRGDSIVEEAVSIATSIGKLALELVQDGKSDEHVLLESRVEDLNRHFKRHEIFSPDLELLRKELSSIPPFSRSYSTLRALEKFSGMARLCDAMFLTSAVMEKRVQSLYGDKQQALLWRIRGID